MDDLQRGLQVIEDIIRRHFRLTAADADKSDLIGHLRKSAARIEALEVMLRECVGAMSVIATAELYDPATGIIDMDVLEVAQDKARTTLTHAKEMLK